MPFLWANLVQPYLFLYPPGSRKVGGQKNFFVRSAREIVPPPLKPWRRPWCPFNSARRQCERNKSDYGGKYLWKRWVLSLEWKVDAVIGDCDEVIYEQDEVNQEDSEQNEVDGMKKDAVVVWNAVLAETLAWIWQDTFQFLNNSTVVDKEMLHFLNSAALAYPYL